MPESIVRFVVFVLLAISTVALSTASSVLKYRRSDKNKDGETSSGSGIEEAEFYSSPLDHLLAEQIPDRIRDFHLSDRGTSGILHLAAKDGDLINIPGKTRRVS